MTSTPPTRFDTKTLLQQWRQQYQRPPTEFEFRSLLSQCLNDFMTSASEDELRTYFQFTLHPQPSPDCGKWLPNGKLTHCPQCKVFIDSTPINARNHPVLARVFSVVL